MKLKTFITCCRSQFEEQARTSKNTFISGELLVDPP